MSLSILPSVYTLYAQNSPNRYVLILLTSGVAKGDMGAGPPS